MLWDSFHVLNCDCYWFSWQEWLTLPISYSQLPKNAELILSIYALNRSGQRFLCGQTSTPIFDKLRYSHEHSVFFLEFMGIVHCNPNSHYLCLYIFTCNVVAAFGCFPLLLLCWFILKVTESIDFKLRFINYRVCQSGMLDLRVISTSANQEAVIDNSSDASTVKFLSDVGLLKIMIYYTDRNSILFCFT